MKKFLVSFLILTAGMQLPAAASAYTWQKVLYYGEEEYVCYDDSSNKLYGWNYINNEWYYFYNDGIMAHDTFIDGYYLGSDGAYTKCIPYAVERIIKVIPDSKWIYTCGNTCNEPISILEHENFKDLCVYGWDAPDIYGTLVCIDYNEYFVGDDGTVYKAPHQAYDTIYKYDECGNITEAYEYNPSYSY